MVWSTQSQPLYAHNISPEQEWILAHKGDTMCPCACDFQIQFGASPGEIVAETLIL